MLFYIVLILILILIAVVAYGTWMRKKTYAHIDRIESWKIDITNRPVTEEIARVKELKMVGETEKKFETWRNDWDEIVTSDLPEVEEQLFDAEEAADKFRFKKSTKILHVLEDRLQLIEGRIEEMLNDLNEVVDSEQQNRKDIVSIKEGYHKVKKDIITRRSQFKNAIPSLEAMLRKVEDSFKAYETESENGNYIHAREILIGIKAELDTLESDLKQIPELYKEIDHNLPNELKELNQAYEEMTEQGYILRHLQLTEQMKEMDRQLAVLSEAMEQKAYEETEESIETMNQQIEWLFQQLEKEVETRTQLHETAPVVKRDLEIVGEKVRGLDEELATIQESYRVDEEDIRVYQDIKNAFEKINKEFVEVNAVREEREEAFSIIYEKIEHMKEDINVLRDSSSELQVKIRMLRKDERLAKETLVNLKKKIYDTNKLVQKSNMPGVPHSFASLVEESEELIDEINLALQKKPLEMTTVQRILGEAQDKINLLYEKAERLVDDAELSEQLIQYGNRYRSSHLFIKEELRRAEEYFRSYNYQESVEIAAAAIEKVEPNILKKKDLYDQVK